MKLANCEAVGKDVVENTSHDTKGEGRTGAQVNEEVQVTITASERDRALKTDFLMEEIVKPENLNLAYKRVVENKGCGGIDKMQVEELGEWIQKNKQELIQQLLEGTYQPQPVKRTNIPKPNGGTRALGIPTVRDRLVQQAILQVLTPILDPLFSESSYGFRPGRSAHQALAKAKEYVAEGRGIVVDIDIEKFFDCVNHDMLMARLARHIRDKRLLRITRKFLQAGIMENGVVMTRTEGTPQGGPLSPLLSNLFLDDLDKELERRGHTFCRYADDCNIYVGSLKAGERVMASTVEFLENRLKLRVNPEKTAVSPSRHEIFPGISAVELWDTLDSKKEPRTNKANNQKNHTSQLREKS